jgi:outer membrane biosynthesis protein TonB
MFSFRFHDRRVTAPGLARAALCRVLLGRVLLGLVLLVAASCEKNPPRTVPEVLVPSIETQPEPVPPSPNPPDENANAEPVEAPAPPQDQQKPKPKPHRPVFHRPAPPQPSAPPVAEAPKPEPPKPADNSVQITADVPRAAVQSQKQNTENLLRNSEDKLNRLSRNLSESELGMMRQARNYMTQSNQALLGGDFERAYNLAVKASLLANELTK